MFKFLYEIIIDPLGLPIGIMEEYIILIIINEIAFQIAYDKVGGMYHSGWITSKAEGSLIHWLVRSVIFVAIWFLLRAAIWTRGFIMDNKVVSIITFIGVTAIIVIYKLSEIRGRKVRLSRVVLDDEENER